MRHRTIAALLLTLAAARFASAAPQDYYAIHVVDDATGRGIPLVYLRSVYKQTYVTDSAGYVAFNEPGLMNGRDVWVSIKSFGYEEPAGAFGIHGLALYPKPGETLEVRLKRQQIAERLYRMTGYGIYRDSVLLGKPTPIEEPLLNAQVTGSDTVQCAAYHGKLMWLWQDTDRISFELGNFAMTGATSEAPAKLKPDEGLSFTYFVPKPGEFAKAMSQVPQEGTHPIWADGLTVVPDEKGRERMICRYVAANKDFSAAQSGLLLYDDDKQLFLPLAKYSGPKGGESTLGPGGHAIYVRDGGVRYVYYGGNVRVKADLASASDPKQYEAFTCLTADGKADRRNGKLVWQWVKGGKPVSFHNSDDLVRHGVLKSDEATYQLKDVESGKPIQAVSAGIAWNDYLKCWLNVFGQRGGDSMVGEIWVSTAASPEGPWIACRKVATHAMKDNNNDFYNPVQHYELNQANGRYVYFSGTFVDTFSGNPWPTPYYNYNNIVYRLDLADPRLKLPPPPPGFSKTLPDHGHD